MERCIFKEIKKSRPAMQVELLLTRSPELLISYFKPFPIWSFRFAGKDDLININTVFLRTSADGGIFVNFKDYFWQGTVVMIKLNKPVSKFNLYKYVR